MTPRRSITQIHEIEVTSRCNLACVYCPHPKMARAKMDMTMSMFMKALSAVDYFCRCGTQGELALTGIGEATLHPKFADMLLMAREVIGRDRLLTFSTNGIRLSDALLHRIRDAHPTVYVSLHRPEVAALAVERLKKRGFKWGTNGSFATSALDWTGTVDWHVSHPPITCEYLRSGWAVIRADGTVGTCCWDAESVSGRIAHLDKENPSTWTTAPHKACDACSLSIPKEVFPNHEQRIPA